jgi:hypothetical protein
MENTELLIDAIKETGQEVNADKNWPCLEIRMQDEV